jgi:putative serine protease PepD
MTENGGSQFGPQRPLPPRPTTPPSGDTFDSSRTPREEETTRQLPPAQSQSGYGRPTYGRPAQGQPVQGQQVYGGYGQAHGADQGVHQSAHQGSHSAAYGSQSYGAFGSSGTGHQSGKAAAGKRFGTGTLVAGMLVAGLVGGGVAGGITALSDGPEQASTAAGGAPRSVIVNNTESVTAITAAAEKASPSVVTIGVSAGGSGGSGSGIILDGEGHILTNTHVVTLGGQTANPAIEVRTNDGRVHQAQVVGTDPLSDLAVIKIDAPNLVPAELGDSGNINVGDTAVAIGAPLGLSGTVTDGIISTLNRTIAVSSSAVPEDQLDAPEGEDGDGFNFIPPDGSRQQEQSQNQGSVYLNVIQTDAAINHGNSGGALVNSNGEIIGVNVAIASATEESGSIGVGFAIPINYAKRISSELIANGRATHGFLGVSVTPAASEGSSDNTGFSVGAEVAEVTDGSPAADAGLRRGDVIVDFAGLPIEDGQALTAAVRQQHEGETVEISYLRDGSRETTDVTVGDSAQQ